MGCNSSLTASTVQPLGQTMKVEQRTQMSTSPKNNPARTIDMTNDKSLTKSTGKRQRCVLQKSVATV